VFNVEPINPTDMNLLQRYQPALSWVNEFDRFLDRSLFNPAFQSGPREAFHETEKSWVLRLDLPGFNKEDVKMTVTDRKLELSAETPEDRPFGGKIERQWMLGDSIDANGIQARLENGVLELVLPKKPEETAEPTTIEVK
jgi:HSP20 family protein